MENATSEILGGTYREAFGVRPGLPALWSCDALLKSGSKLHALQTLRANRSRNLFGKRSGPS